MTQDQILRACDHTDRQTSEVTMGHGEIIKVCCQCWNASVSARRNARKLQLAEHWTKYREAQAVAMHDADAHIGQRVQYFAASMLGAAFGGILVTGTIRVNRNAVAYVHLDRSFGGKKSTEWNKSWKGIV
jgi:hypothetical protein